MTSRRIERNRAGESGRGDGVAGGGRYCGMFVTAVLAAAVVLCAGSAALATRPLGFDLSVWDGDVTPAQWAQLYNAGYAFCFTKATQGTTITDSTFVNNMNRGRAAGILMGCYHFADPTVNTATAEANYFVSVARSYISAGYLRPVLDLERGDTLGRTALSQWANAWMNAVQQQTGVEPILYCNPNYATNYLDSTLANRNVWIAHYLTNPDPQNGSPSTGIFPTWNFWQYTANGTLPGLSGSKDLDVFNGTAADLQAFVIGGAPQVSFIVESRPGGLNHANYSETGIWSDSSCKSTAAGCTGGIGSRWCTITSSPAAAVFRFTPSVGGTYEVFTTNCNTSNSGNPLIHRVSHAGGSIDVPVCQNSTCGNNAINKWYSLGQYTFVAGTEYNVTLDGSTGSGSAPANNAGRSDAIRWVLISAAQSPTITQQPQSQIVCAGSTAAFSVAATGEGTLAYQWQKNQANLSNGGHYSGVTTATLTVSGADSSDAANYRCVVSNAYGSTISNEASLTIGANLPAPTDGTPTADATDRITWKWSDITGETGYRVKNSGGTVVSGDLPAGTTQWQESGLAANTQYTRRVYAFSSCGESAASAGQSRYTLQVTPDVPYIVHDATLTTTGMKVRLYRDSATQTVLPNYNVGGSYSDLYRWNGSSWALANHVVGGYSTTFSGLSANTRYGFKGLAANAEGVQTPMGPEGWGYTAIETPGGVSITAVTAASITVAPVGTFSNLTSGNSGVRITNVTTGTDSGWRQNTSEWVCSSLAANTAYGFVARARNGDAYETADCPAVTKWTLSAAPTAGSVIPSTTSPSVNTTVMWTTASDFGPGGVQYYRYAWDQSASHVWTGSEPVWSNGVLSTVPDAAGAWYLHVQGYNGEDAANGTYDYSIVATYRVAADLDHDGDVDLADFAVFQGCFNGPNRPGRYSGCDAADLDTDLDVDLADFAIFQACFNGPNRPPRCS